MMTGLNQLQELRLFIQMITLFVSNWFGNFQFTDRIHWNDEIRIDHFDIFAITRLC